jgi:hypothetical protein
MRPRLNSRKSVALLEGFRQEGSYGLMRRIAQASCRAQHVGFFSTDHEVMIPIHPGKGIRPKIRNSVRLDTVMLLAMKNLDNNFEPNPRIKCIYPALLLDRDNRCLRCTQISLSQSSGFQKRVSSPGKFLKQNPITASRFSAFWTCSNFTVHQVK